MHTALQPFWFIAVVLSTTPQPFNFGLLHHLGVPDGWLLAQIAFFRPAR